AAQAEIASPSTTEVSGETRRRLRAEPQHRVPTVKTEAKALAEQAARQGRPSLRAAAAAGGRGVTTIMFPNLGGPGVPVASAQTTSEAACSSSVPTSSEKQGRTASIAPPRLVAAVAVREEWFSSPPSN